MNVNKRLAARTMSNLDFTCSVLSIQRAMAHVRDCVSQTLQTFDSVIVEGILVRTRLGYVTTIEEYMQEIRWRTYHQKSPV